MSRVYNFSAGPATLPESVLKKVQEELLDWQRLGYSVLEMSHRSAEFIGIAEETTNNLRELLKVPSHYKILFMPGGGRGQFAAVPLNLLGKKKKANYVVTGTWSELATQEAERYCQVVTSTHSKENRYTTIASQAQWTIDPEGAYLHYTDNETIHGLEFPTPPASHGLPLICDMSSNILSRPIDVSQFAIIYACTQKNMGSAGITVAIVREDVLDRYLPFTPSVLCYKEFAENESMPNTPPTFNWYLTGLVVQWVMAEGGLEVMHQRAQEKSRLLYQYIDNSEIFDNNVDPHYRSRMNVVFTLPTEALTEKFLKEAKKEGLTNLKGHRVLGGIRASLYNAQPKAGVVALIEFMRHFEKIH